MRIAYCTGLFPCRSEQFLLRELSYLRSRGIKITVFSLGAPVAADRHPDWQAERVPVTYRPVWLSWQTPYSVVWLCGRPLKTLRLLGLAVHLLISRPQLGLQFVAHVPTMASFSRTVCRSRVGLVHAYFVNLPGLIGMGVSILTGVPLTAAAHARDVFVDGPAVDLLVRRARLIIACNADAAEVLRSRVPEGSKHKIKVVHHGLLIEAESQSERTSAVLEHEPMLLAAGRFVRKKGFDVLIHALARLRQNGEEMRLVLVGDGPQAGELRKLAEELGVAGNISWPGWITETLLNGLLHQSTAVILPSVIAIDGDRDGIPNVVLEAWAASAPVIASALPGLSEAIEHEGNGILVEPGDVDELADAISQVVRDPCLRERMVASAKQRLLTEFNMETNGRRLLQLFAGARDGNEAA